MKQKLLAALPAFSAQYKIQGGDSLIHYYEGSEAIKAVYRGLLRDIESHDDYLVVANQKAWLEQDPEFFMDFIRRRAKLNINIRILAQDSPVAREHKRLERNFNETLKILPAKTNLTTNLVITPQKVVIHQIVSPIFAMVMENKNIIQMHREQFEIIWNSIE